MIERTYKYLYLVYLYKYRYFKRSARTTGSTRAPYRVQYKSYQEKSNSTEARETILVRSSRVIQKNLSDTLPYLVVTTSELLRHAIEEQRNILCTIFLYRSILITRMIQDWRLFVFISKNNGKINKQPKTTENETNKKYSIEQSKQNNMPMAKPDDGVLPKFEIRPPSTLKDDGKISASLSKDVQRIFQFIDDERHLTAHTLLHSIYDRINSWESKYDIKIDAAHHHQHHHQHTNNATTKNGVNNKNNINGDNAVKNKATLFLSNLTNQKNTINNGHTNHNNAMIFKKLSKLEKVKYTNEMNEIVSVKQILQKKDDIIVTLEVRS